MQHYPQATYSFFEPKFYGESDKVTCEVTCIVSIGELTRTSTLPVMTSSMPMKSVINPSSRDINDARQRARDSIMKGVGQTFSAFQMKGAKGGVGGSGFKMKDPMFFKKSIKKY